MKKILFIASALLWFSIASASVKPSVAVDFSATLPSSFPLVYVYPESTSANVGENFTMSIVIYNLTDAYTPDPYKQTTIPLGNLYGLDIQFTWDPTVIKYVSHTLTMPVETYPTPIPPSPYAGIIHGYGAPANQTILIVKNVVNEAGNISGAADPSVRAWFVAATFFPATPFNGNGTVFTMTFTVLQSGISPLHIVDCTLADKNGVAIAKDSNGQWLNPPRDGIWVIPEFPSALIMPLFIAVSAIAVVLAKKRLSRKLPVIAR